ncbi:hypothetical protein WICPIJ_007557 [Wickerhamomyces pijperi]|uniref:Glycosyltransferase family 71 protein n=1 Tax=Wickerhamomyces pijperi TaxID=599730 RepID=A0A9P8PZP6_WICPI|nr:hypothetical protein WICPIJ_007557 [Wickerhamomyces pijperi]
MRPRPKSIHQRYLNKLSRYVQLHNIIQIRAPYESIVATGSQSDGDEEDSYYNQDEDLIKDKPTSFRTNLTYSQKKTTLVGAMTLLLVMLTLYYSMNSRSESTVNLSGISYSFSTSKNSLTTESKSTAKSNKNSPIYYDSTSPEVQINIPYRKVIGTYPEKPLEGKKDRHGPLSREAFQVIGISESEYNKKLKSKKELDGVSHPLPFQLIKDQTQTGKSEPTNTRIFNIIQPTSSITEVIPPPDNLFNPALKQYLTNQLIPLLLSSHPQVKHSGKDPSWGINEPNHYHGGQRIPMFGAKYRDNEINEPVRTKEYLLKFFKLFPGEFEELKDSHYSFVKGMMSEFPGVEIDNYWAKLYGKKQGERRDGILYVGGGKYNWLVLLSLKKLRDTGSVLPVEVFIPSDEDYSYDLCTRAFPQLGARCVLVSDYLLGSDQIKANGETMNKNMMHAGDKFTLAGYQYKPLALLLTSFTNVLMLDSDNFPMQNPDILFHNVPFTNHDLVIWPDIWRRSTSPIYYQVAGVSVDESKQVSESYGDFRDRPSLESGGAGGAAGELDYSKISYHDLKGAIPEASSETGQMLINKTRHMKTIILAMYYNYYGPTFYYPMLSQGQAGEGDKETFLAAANYFDMTEGETDKQGSTIRSYYQVQEYVREFGIIIKGGSENDPLSYSETLDFHITAMAQYDPILDYIQSQTTIKDNSAETGRVLKNPYISQLSTYTPQHANYNRHRHVHSRIFFLHTNIPKLYPWELVLNIESPHNLFHPKMKYRPRRMYSKILTNEIGFNVELEIWKTINGFLCQNGTTSDTPSNEFPLINIEDIFKRGGSDGRNDPVSPPKDADMSSIENKSNPEKLQYVCSTVNRYMAWLEEDGKVDSVLDPLYGEKVVKAMEKKFEERQNV